MKWKPTRSAIADAGSTLPKLVDKYVKAGRKATDGKRSPEELHQFRVKTKRFRYTLEMFRPLYGASLDKELDPIRELQSALGKLHDYHIIATLLAGDQAAEAKLRRLTKKKLKEFHQRWEDFDSKKHIKRWKELLAGRDAKSVTVRRKKKSHARGRASGQ